MHVSFYLYLSLDGVYCILIKFSCTLFCWSHVSSIVFCLIIILIPSVNVEG